MAWPEQVYKSDMRVENENTIKLADFRNAIDELKAGMKREYDRGVNRDLSQQRNQDVFRRNVTTVLRENYQQALARLQQLMFENGSPANKQSEDQDHALSAKLLQSFDGVIEELIVYALQKHRSSCALSNFPDEHHPSEAYLAKVIEDTSRDWSAFAVQVNNMVAISGNRE